MTASASLKSKRPTCRADASDEIVRAARCCPGPDQFTDDASGTGVPAGWTVMKPPPTVLVAVRLYSAPAAFGATEFEKSNVVSVPLCRRPNGAPGWRESATRAGVI